MEYTVKAYNIWEVGQRFDENGMPHQEDALYPGYGRCVAEDRLFVLCDGMGGHDHGEIASSVVCDALSQSVLRQLRSGSGRFREGVFDIALGEAYDALDSNDTGSAKKMGTTMAMLCLYEKGYFMAHIGDTRVYHIRPGDDGASTQIIFSTTDHSLVNRLLANGKISMAEAQASPRRHVITRAMQPHMQARPRADIEMSSDIRQGDYFLMATHGMLDGLSDSEIRHIFSREGGGDREKFSKLREATANNRDNHSAIIVHIENVYLSRNSKDMSARSQREAVDTGAGISASMEKSRGMTKEKPVSSSKGGKFDFGRLITRIMVGVVVCLSVVMLVYYAFIREDEAMLEVGRSAVSTSDYDPNKYEEEQFGYETKVSEVIDDRVIDDGTNDEIEETPAEEETPADEPENENPEREPAQEPASEPAQTPEPVSDPDVPILQE